MKNPTLILAISLISFCIVHLACTPDEERQLSDQSPALAPATRAAEKVQQSIDRYSPQVQQVSNAIQKVATDGQSIGVPFAGIVVLAATAVGSLLGAYNERRTRTAPLQSAVSQIVQSVESAFPTKSKEQKSAMATIQDQATKRLVSEIKGG